MSSALSAPPLQSPIVEVTRSPGTFPGQMTRVFENWLRSLVNRAQVSAYTVTSATVTAQTASIGLTSLIPLATVGAYRVTYRFRLLTAGGVSSSLLVTIASTDDTVSCTQSSVAYTGNAVNAPQSGSFLVQSDAAPIQYSTTYASVGAPAMAYELDLIVESM